MDQFAQGNVPEQARQLRVSFDRLRADIEALSGIGRTAEGGISRHAFSEQYESARVWLKSQMTAAGLKAYDDQAGNTFGRLDATGDMCVMSGSHIDTVPNGGPLDGAYGVLAALEVARVLGESGLELPTSFEVAAFVEEEGRYFDCLGAKSVVGELVASDVMNAVDPTGTSLAEVMRNAGFAPEAADQARRRDVASYIEIHIEQGPVLEHAGCTIGVVQGIAGIQQNRITFTGQPDHAGTTPLELRRDAAAAAFEYAHLAKEFVSKSNDDGSARFTIGDIKVTPGAANVVPSKAVLLQEIRHLSSAKISELLAECNGLARKIATRNRVEVGIEDISCTPPVAMDEGVQSLIEDAANLLCEDFINMPSGAGHDAQVIAKIAPSGMIFVPSIAGRSHCPEEWTTLDDLERGANVLLQAVISLMWRG